MKGTIKIYQQANKRISSLNPTYLQDSLENSSQ